MNQPSSTTDGLAFVVTNKIFDRYLRRDLAVILILCLLLLIVVLGFVALPNLDDPDAPRILTWMAGSMLAGFVLAGVVVVVALKLIYRQGVTRVFEINATGVRYTYAKSHGQPSNLAESAVTAAGSLTGNVHWRSYMEKEKANRSITWDQISRFKSFDRDLVIQIYRGLIPAIRIYCPDTDTYSQAQSMVKSHVSA